MNNSSLEDLKGVIKADDSYYVLNTDVKDLFSLITVKKNLYIGNEFNTLSFLNSTCKVKSVGGCLNVMYSAVNKYPNLIKVGGDIIIKAHNLPIPRRVQFKYLVLHYTDFRGRDMHMALRREVYIKALDRVTNCPLTELALVRNEGALEEDLSKLRLTGNL